MTTADPKTTSIPLFAGLRRSQLRQIDRLGVWLELGGGRVLCREGEPGDEFFVLVDGTVGAQSSDGVVSILRSGAWFGEVALLTGANRCATVTTFTPSTVVVYEAREFDALLRIAPEIRARLESRAAQLDATSRPTAPANDRPPVYRPAGAGTRAGRDRRSGSRHGLTI